MTNDPVTSLRLPTPLRDEIQRRIQAGEFKNQTDLVHRAVSEYFDRHPDTTATDLPYDHGDRSDL